jgi:DNA-binding XRE family transcriptional regulator
MENRLKVRRAERDITQLDLALEVGISNSQISQIERGYVDPTPELAAKIAKALKTTPESIFPPLAEQQNAGAR